MVSDAPGLYVHVPFCVTKCPYCAFYSEIGSMQVSQWLDAISREVASYSGQFAPFDTLYLGGGTPSVLTDSELQVLLDTLRGALPMADDTEVTIELNPGDITKRRAECWSDMGIARASVGVQSFDDGALRFLGRRHDAQQAWDALVALRNAGFWSVGVDLIWGIPGQGDAQCLASLERALTFGPEHLSCYELTVESGTPLQLLVAAGDLRVMGEDAAANLASEFWGRLAAAGYDHYEVSNFARGPSHQSRHNTKYWRHVPYLGLGPSAHSFDGTRRWANVRSLNRYVKLLFDGARPTAFEETLSDEQRQLERIALGIRTARGVCREDVPGGWVRAMQAEGWVYVQDDRVRPTESGMLVADGLARSLIESWGVTSRAT